MTKLTLGQLINPIFTQFLLKKNPISKNPIFPTYLLMKCLKGALFPSSVSSSTMSNLSTLAHRELFLDSLDTEILRWDMLSVQKAVRCCVYISSGSSCQHIPRWIASTRRFQQQPFIQRFNLNFQRLTYSRLLNYILITSQQRQTVRQATEMSFSSLEIVINFMKMTTWICNR